MNIFEKFIGFDQVLSSESGRFFCIKGIVQKFEPELHNIIKGGINLPKAYVENSTIHYQPAVKTMIVPTGVKGFRDGFFREGAVTDIFILPETVTSIGSNNDTWGPFCGCYLPEVILPENLRFIGNYAFSSSYIEKLVVRASNVSPYLRQFKDSTIRKVYLPSGQHSENTEGGGKYGFYANFHNHCKCEIINY